MNESVADTQRRKLIKLDAAGKLIKILYFASFRSHSRTSSIACPEFPIVFRGGGGGVLRSICEVSDPLSV